MALQDKEAPSLYRFSDTPQPPDPFLTEDYVDKHQGKGTTIVIDNGCWQCRVGWSCDKDPSLVFRNAIAKTRGKKGDGDNTCIGNDITHIEAVRSSLRNQFDRNLVFNFGHQEQIFDYAFSHLGLGEEPSVDHPVVITEPVCNPSYCRAFMTELLFEGYGVPSLAYGIDALFSAHHHWTRRGVALRDALVISSGQQTTHLIPLLDGRIDSEHCKRINLGGMHSVSYLHRLLQLKYPDLQAHVSLSRAQELLEHHCYTALDYTGELKEWASGLHDNNYRVIQLPYNQAAGGSIVSDVSREVKDRQRKQRARMQLLKLNQRKREEKIASYQEQLERLAHLQQLQETEDAEDFQIIIEEAGYESIESLYQAMERVKTSLESEQEKLATLVKNLSADPSQTEAAGEQKGEEPISEEWLQSLKERRKELLEQKRHRHQRKAELGKRRSAASQNRMRIISQLGADDTQIKKRSKKTKEDTFGMNDEDWNVYRDISKTAGESDSEREDMELSEISKVLEKHDPSFSRASSGPTGDLSSYYQLSLGVERLRVPEIIFQPTMVGVDQCGISDTMEFILQYYPPEVQQRLVENVYITGGNTMFPNFAERVQTDLQAMRPFKSSFSVSSAEDGLLDAWRGGCSWANSDDSQSGFISRADYEEHGVEYFKEHVTSNLSITPMK